MRVVKYLSMVVAGLIAFVLIIGATYKESPEHFETRKRECVNALMSSMGTDTSNYTDNMAYKTYVHEHCEGLEINGVPLDK